jgi:ribonuclease HIII
MPPARGIIGVDESGKGDFFGPLVIAALSASRDDLAWLDEIGVRDSKLIANNKLLTIDERLRARFVHAVIVYRPREYNRRYAEIKNLNKLLAEGHARAIADVLAQSKAELAISDKFGKTELIEQALHRLGVTIKLQQLVRGEAVPQVAAASILARAAFLREMETLSARLKMEIPRGAGAIVDEAGRKLAAKHPGLDFSTIAKTHFKNYQRIRNPGLFAG